MFLSKALSTEWVMQDLKSNGHGSQWTEACVSANKWWDPLGMWACCQDESLHIKPKPSASATYHLTRVHTEIVEGHEDLWMADKLCGKEPRLKITTMASYILSSIFACKACLNNVSLYLFMQYIQVVSFVGCLYCIFTASKNSICDVFTVTHIRLLTINACAAFNHRYPWKTLTHSLNKNRKMKTGDRLNYQIIQDQRQMKDRWHAIFILLYQWANSLLGLMPPEENEDLNAQPTQNVIKLFDF